MGALTDLLEVQEHDSAIDRLRARREKLPERQQLTERTAEVGVIEAQLAEVRAKRDEALREERQLDDNVSALDTRVAEVEEELFSGRTSSPRELQAMQADLEQLRRQRSGLEDQELDVMERREGLDGEIAQFDEKLAAARAGIAELESAIAALEAEIDAELAAQQQARDAAAAKVPADLLSTYDDIRARSGGVGAALLSGGSCMGCHLALPSMEVDRIKKLPADEPARCEQCGAILVRP